MGNFLLGLVVAFALAAGLYYYFVVSVQKEVAEEEQGAGLNLEVNHIPKGAVMEDGTLD